MESSNNTDPRGSSDMIYSEYTDYEEEARIKELKERLMKEEELKKQEESKKEEDAKKREELKKEEEEQKKEEEKPKKEEELKKKEEELTKKEEENPKDSYVIKNSRKLFGRWIREDYETGELFNEIEFRNLFMEIKVEVKDRSIGKFSDKIYYMMSPKNSDISKGAKHINEFESFQLS